MQPPMLHTGKGGGGSEVSIRVQYRVCSCTRCMQIAEIDSCVRTQNCLNIKAVQLYIYKNKTRLKRNILIYNGHHARKQIEKKTRRSHFSA